MLRKLFCLLLSSGLLLSASPGRAEVVNMAVGQVGDHVVTAREVWLSLAYEAIRFQLTATSDLIHLKPGWKVLAESDSFRQAASSYMLEIMIAKEAEVFSIAEVSEKETQSQSQRVEKACEGEVDFKKLEYKNSEIHTLLRTKTRAQNFLKFKTESAGVTIGDEEAKAYYEKNRLKFGNMPFSQFVGPIKDVLSKKQLEERLKDWFEVLKRKYRVRFLGQIET